MISALRGKLSGCLSTSRGRVLGLALSLVCLQSAAQAATSSTDTERLALDTLMQARQVYALARRPIHAETFVDAGKRERLLIAELNRLAEVAQSPRSVRQLAIMQRIMRDPGWRASLMRLPALMHTRSPFEAERELAMWHEAFGADKIRSSRVNLLHGRISRLDLGWYEHLAMEVVYKSAGMDDAAQEESDAALRSASSLVWFLQAQEAVGRLGIVLGAGMAAFCFWKKIRPDSFISRSLAFSAPSDATAVQANGLYRIFGTYLATYAAIQLALSYTLGGFAQGTLSRMGLSGAILSIGVMLLWISLPAVLLWRHARRTGMTAADLGLTSRRPIGDILWGIGGYAVAVPLVWLASSISDWLFNTHETPLSPIIRDFAGTRLALVQALLICQATIIAPIAEEVFFRGVFYKSLSAKMRWIPAAAITALLFAVVHPQLPGGFLSLLALGIVFNTLYALRGSLLPSITAHAINNAAVFVSLSLLLAS